MKCEIKRKHRVNGILWVLLASLIMCMFMGNWYNRSFMFMIYDSFQITDFFEKYYISNIILQIFICLALYIIKKFAMNRCGLKIWEVVILHLIFNIAFFVSVGGVVKYKKENASGLYSLTMEDNRPYLTIGGEDGELKYIYFNTDIRNLSKEARTFRVKIPLRNLRGDVELYGVLDKDGNPAMFTVEGEKRRSIVVRHDNYTLEGLDLEKIIINKEDMFTEDFIFRYIIIENEDESQYIYSNSN